MAEPAHGVAAWPRLAFIGSAGIPNRYGGFESFLEHCTAPLVERGVSVLVTCDAHLYPEEDGDYRGVHRRFITIPANGWLSPVHDLLAFLKVMHEVDVVVVLGVSAGIFLPMMRVVARLFGKRLMVNIDGVEWRRTKFSRKKRWLLRSFDLLAQVGADAVVYDNPALRQFVYPMFRGKAEYIAYSGDHVLRLPPNPAALPDTALTICRIEPENNLELLIDGALASRLSRYTIIGNWNNSSYGRALRTRHAGQERLQLLDPVYEATQVARHREDCAVYLHGHSVGGTNPSLVEMLFYDSAILCYDCAFNRETAGPRADYFATPQQLAGHIDHALQVPRTPGPPPEAYTAERIADRYLQVAAALAQRRFPSGR